ncbi:unnamed protein product [Rhodiola kirilowii]
MRLDILNRFNIHIGLVLYRFIQFAARHSVLLSGASFSEAENDIKSSFQFDRHRGSEATQP